MPLINLIQHPLTLRNETGEEIVLPPSGTVARVKTTPGELVQIAGIPVPVAKATTYGAIENVPDPQPDTWYIVSGMVLAAAKTQYPDRRDILAPGTGPQDGAIRNDQGQVIAVTRLLSNEE